MAEDLEQQLHAERAARAAAEQAVRDRDALLAGVSHDLRTPVAAIVMWIDVLRNNPGQLTRGLAALERSARAQTRILDELLVRMAASDPPPELPQSSPSSPEPSATLHGVRVLVVEDEPDVRELLRWSLEASHAEVHTASSVDEALRVLADRRPDVLIIDIGLPERDGLSLIRAVRALEPLQGGLTPAVALTELAHADDRTRALLAGYQFHISKPVDAAALIAATTTLAGRNR